MLFDDKYINKVDKRLLKSAEIQACIEILGKEKIREFSMKLIWKICQSQKGIRN